MHILYVSQYFPPEMGAPAARVYELSREWVRAGYRVTVVTGFPNHPDGRVPPEYAPLLRRGTVTERIDGIDVVRTWLYPAANRGRAKRMLNYASFALSAALRGSVLSRPDLVIGTSPQLLGALAGWVLARRFRRPFVFEVRDLWPESLPAVGAGSANSALYRSLAHVARLLYRQAAVVVPVSERFTPTILEYEPRANVAVVENGVDTDQFRPALDAAAVKERLGLAGRFVVSYVGTVGMAHGLQALLAAARRLKTCAPDVLLLVVGEGAERERLTDLARREGLDNVRFVGQRPRAQIPDYLAASDICLVLLRKSEVFETVLPSKMLECMACGAAVIVGVDGLARSLVEESGAGIYVEPENSDALIAAILHLRGDAGLRAGCGSRGRTFIEQRFTRRAKASAYLAALRALTTAPRILQAKERAAC